MTIPMPGHHVDTNNQEYVFCLLFIYLFIS